MPIPAFKRWYYKPARVYIDGCMECEGLYINHKLEPWNEWDITSYLDNLSICYYLKHRSRDLQMTIMITLKGNIVKYVVDNICEGKQPIYTIEFKGMPIFRFNSEFSFMRDLYSTVHWDSEIARGLWRKEYECVSIFGAQPDDAPKPHVHACAYNGKVCCFIKTDWPILPLWTRAVESKLYPGRSEFLELGMNGWQYRVRDKIIGRFEAHIELVSDLNHDGKADECEYQLAMKKLLPNPDVLYRDSIWYKVFCASPKGVFTTFQQALEIAKRIYYLSNGIPQIMYLVGWQYDGHDTGYPAMNKLNQKLGSREDLLYLIRTAKKKYNCIVSVHANVDDSYEEHPQWNPELIGRDIDGSLMKWEKFNARQSFHICHTKDVESGSIFRRIDEMLSIVPIVRTVHFDAFRTMNWSWEEDGFIGEPEELFCGMLPIKRYLNQKGIDITTESLNGMRIEPAGIFSGIWHNRGLLPLLYHNKIYGGARGRTPVDYVAGTSLNIDFIGKNIEEQMDELDDRIGMDYMLYRFFLMREMVEYRLKEKKIAFARYEDGVQVYGDNLCNMLKVIWDHTLIADNTTRFIPFDDFIYAYATEDCEIKRVLPKDWHGTHLHGISLFPDVGVPHVNVKNNTVLVKLFSRIPVVICRK
jgi:hypothetical protein